MKKLLAALVATTALAAPALAQDKITEFRIGILGGENAQDRLASNECYRAKAEALLGVPVKMFTPADYDGVIQGLLGGTIDMAWLGPSAYAKAYLTNPEAVEPIMVKTNVDGSYGYYSIGFARKDSGITSLADMKGKVFAFGDPNSASGYLIPAIEIPQTTGASMESGDYHYFGRFLLIGYSPDSLGSFWVIHREPALREAGGLWEPGGTIWKVGWHRLFRRSGTRREGGCVRPMSRV